MKEGPDFERVANVILGVLLRIVVDEDDEPKGGLGANSGILPRIDRRASRRGLLNRGPDGQAPFLRFAP